MDGTCSRGFVAVAVRLVGSCALLAFIAGACASGNSGSVAVDPTSVPGGMYDTPNAATAYPAPRLTRDAALAGSQGTSEACGAAAPIEAVDMVTYTNQVLGLSFAYPAQMGDVVFDVRAGELSGYLWSLTFPRCFVLSLSGRSRDYSGDTGDPSDNALGFARDGKGGYLWLSRGSSEGYPVNVREVLAADGTDVVLFAKSCGPGTEGDDCLGILANLAGDEFPGFIARPEQHSARLPYETLRAILSTIRVWPPTEPLPTLEPEP